MNIDVSKLTVTELDELIVKAAQRRAALEPKHSNEPPNEAWAIPDPRWQTQLHGQDTLFRVLHPGFGWLSFLIPPHERANLLSVFLRQALIPASPAAPQTPPTGAGGGTVH